MPALTLRTRLALTATLAAALAAPAALASPCAAPADYVKSPQAARSPLLRPFMLAGLATTALQQRDNEHWLELAAPDVATVQRALAGVAAAPRLSGEAGGVVLLACSSLGSTAQRLALQGGVPLSTPLW